MARNWEHAISDKVDRFNGHCPRGHAVAFGQSPGGVVSCVCPQCIAQTGTIYRGHGLNRRDAYLRLLLSIANW